MDLHDRQRNQTTKRSASLALFAAVMALLVAQGAQAASLRCGQDLIQPGDSYLEVTDACGDSDRQVELVGENDQRVGTALYYRGDYGRADRKVYLRGGTVTAIERLD